LDLARCPGEQFVAFQAGVMVEGAGRDHQLVGFGAGGELGQRVGHGGGITDHVRVRLVRHHRLLSG